MKKQDKWNFPEVLFCHQTVGEHYWLPPVVARLHGLQFNILGQTPTVMWYYWASLSNLRESPVISRSSFVSFLESIHKTLGQVRNLDYFSSTINREKWNKVCFSKHTKKTISSIYLISKNSITNPFLEFSNVFSLKLNHPIIVIYKHLPQT